jgi:hypothetical protein
MKRCHLIDELDAIKSLQRKDVIIDKELLKSPFLWVK